MSKAPKLRFKEFSGEWESKCLEELFTFKNGLNKEKEFFGKGSPIVNFTDVYKNRGLKLEDIKGLVDVNEKELENYNVSKGDVFFTRTSETIDDIGMSSVILDEVKNTVFSGFVLRARPKNDILADKFKKYCFSTFNARKEIVTKSSFTTRALTSGTLLNGVEINYPSKEEQEKIASFISLIDDKISLQSEKVEALKDYKKGMMQKIFSRELRFKDDEGRDYPDWEEKKLGNYIVEYKEKTIENNQYPVLTSARQGIVLQKDYFKDRQVTTDDNIGYHIIPRGYLTYRSRSDDATFKFNQNNIIDIGIVSYFYPVFKFNEDLNSIYALTYMNNYLGYQIRREIVGTSQLVLSLNKLKDLKIKVPSIEEQNKIGNLLDSLENKIKKEQEKLDSLNEYKEGLLQQMFI